MKKKLRLWLIKKLDAVANDAKKFIENCPYRCDWHEVIIYSSYKEYLNDNPA